MNPEFEVHMLNDQGRMKARMLAQSFDGLLTHLIHVLPAGRELSTVKTKLEEACFFAKKAVAQLPENQENR